MTFLTWCRNEWERATAATCVVGGLAALLLGWIGLSGEGLVTQQIPYLVSGAIFGIFLLAVGATLWLSADMHDEWVKLDRLEEAVTRAYESGSTRTAVAQSAQSASPFAAAPDDAAEQGVPAGARVGS